MVAEHFDYIFTLNLLKNIKLLFIQNLRFQQGITMNT